MTEKIVRGNALNTRERNPVKFNPRLIANRPSNNWALGSNYSLFWYVALFTTLYKLVGYHVACSSTPGRMPTHSKTHSFSFISLLIFWKLEDDFIHHTLDTVHCKMEAAKSPQERLEWSIKSLIVMIDSLKSAIIIAYNEEGITARGVTWVTFCWGYVPLASQNPYHNIVYSVAKYRPHLSHFWENVIFAIPT